MAYTFSQTQPEIEARLKQLTPLTGLYKKNMPHCEWLCKKLPVEIQAELPGIYNKFIQASSLSLLQAAARSFVSLPD
ncbi:MAG: hypothetical protein EXR81_04295 [Gammaproteobacteria bacterium]|nr:hypothetical protein [Gammaproteobacteria bacterium]